ncbi:MAG: oligoendopeptidase F [Thermomicrobiales bacterium]|nr:oligoendopeptidase F [Thermomicrobiales bacterium]
MATDIEHPRQLTRAEVPAEDTWDLTTIYPDDATWETEAARVPEETAVIAAWRGRLGESAEGLRDALDALMRLHLTVERVRVYATLRHHEDMANPTSLARYERSASIGIAVAAATAFFDPELLAIDPTRFAELAADTALTPYRHLLGDVERRRPHTRSIEVEEVLAQQSDVARGASEAFGALDNADLEYGVVGNDLGEPVVLTKGSHAVLLRSKNRGVRRASQEAFIAPYLAHRHTLAALYAASVRGDVFTAKVRGFASARDAALFANAIPGTVYDTLIATVREARPLIARYLDLRRRVLGLRELEVFDLQVPLSPQPEMRYAYRPATEMVLRGLKPLGGEYTADLGSGFANRWVDVLETKGKRSGAYSWGVYGSPPVILMNWNGTIGDVFTLAHEAGHAMHTYYADRAQPYHDAQYPIFLAEIASTVNETLMNWRLVADMPPDDALGRFALLNRFADTFFGTVVRQTMFAEFEERAHARVEAGTPLTLEILDTLYGDLYADYTPGVRVDDSVRINWGRIPHFYRAFYVYQYATGMSAAISLAAAVRDEGETARQRLLNLLRAGGSDYPLNLLSAAGVDLSTPAPIRAGLAEFERTIAAMEAVEASGALKG